MVDRIRNCASVFGALDQPLWSQFIERPRSAESHDTFTVGVLQGEGIGPETVAAALQVLNSIAEVRSLEFDVVHGGAIGRDAIVESGSPLSDSVIRFCEDIFARQGAVLTGPGGDRFVYDMRCHFNLFCKLNPLIPEPAILDCGVFKPQHLSAVDILVVRDNSGGVYQGQWSESRGADGLRKAGQQFTYEESQVNRLLRVAARIARQRRGKLTVVSKPNGIPTISQLWIECAAPITKAFGVTLEVLEIDNAVYQLIQSPSSFDVIAAPNLFGDIVADLGGAASPIRNYWF